MNSLEIPSATRSTLARLGTITCMLISTLALALGTASPATSHSTCGPEGGLFNPCASLDSSRMRNDGDVPK